MDWALPVVAATVFVSPVAMVSTVLSPVGVTLGSGVLAAVVGVVAFRKRSDPMAWPLVVFLFAIAVWTIPSALRQTLTAPGLELLLLRVEYVGVVTAPVAYLFAALRYAGHEQWFDRQVYAAIGTIPAVTVGLAWTSSWHELLWTATQQPVAGGTELVVENELWVWVALAYSYVVVVAGLFVLANVALGARPVHRRQSALLFLGGLAPLAGNALAMTGIVPAPETGLTAPALTVSGLTFAVATFRYDFLNLSPAAYRNVSDIFGDGVLVFDDDCRLVDANEGARDILDQSIETGDSVETLFGQSLDTLDGTILSTTRDRQRFYRVRHEPLRNHQDQVVGHVVAMREVTEQKRHEQRLEVANRILRHNLRNELNVILGQAVSLQQSLPEEREALVSIREAASRLNDLGEKARHIQSSLSWDADAHRQVDLVAAVTTVVVDCREAYPTARIALDGPDEALVRAPSAGVVETVVGNLIENAVEHNDSHEPRVDVEIRVRNGTVTLEVADDGPGIPPGEIAVLQQGSETKLEHGSGIGLWLVHWFVAAMGGDIAFHEAGGTVVEVTLERADSPASADTTESEPAEVADD
jgi:signal transduction histidine kinase